MTFKKQAILLNLLKQACCLYAADEDLMQHSLCVGRNTRVILAALNPKITSRTLDTIETLTYFHDIGKLFVDAEILDKPSKLTQLEFEEVKKHTTHAVSYIDNVLFRYLDSDELEMLRDICLYHHENYDGSGYPFGIAGNDIHLIPAIVSISDVYDALRRDRCYKPALSHEQALHVMKDMCNTKFDPKHYKIFLSVSEVLRKSYDTRKLVKSKIC